MQQDRHAFFWQQQSLGSTFHNKFTAVSQPNFVRQNRKSFMFRIWFFYFCWRLDSRVAESEVKYPTPTFPKFPTPTPQHKGNEIWLLKPMEIVVHSKKSSVSTKSFKRIYHFNRNSQFKSDIKNDPIGHPELDKKIRLRLHSKPSDSL